MLSCHHCSQCLGGHYHLCDERRIYSYIPLTEAPGLWGGYSQYMYLHPNTVMHKVDASLPAEIAVMFNPLGAGFRWAVEIPNTQIGDTVVILGPGQRGLASVIACREAGAGICDSRLRAVTTSGCLGRSFPKRSTRHGFRDLAQLLNSVATKKRFFWLYPTQAKYIVRCIGQ